MLPAKASLHISKHVLTLSPFFYKEVDPVESNVDDDIPGCRFAIECNNLASVLQWLVFKHCRRSGSAVQRPPLRAQQGLAVSARIKTCRGQMNLLHVQLTECNNMKLCEGVEVKLHRSGLPHLMEESGELYVPVSLYHGK